MEKTADSSIINVIDDFDYSTQDESYNEKFIGWRRKKDNRFSYSFESNAKESIFVDGRGFVSTNMINAEKETLSHIFYVIGVAMLTWVVIDNIVSKIFIILLSFAKVNIHTNFFSYAIYGGSREVVSVLIVISAVKMLLPMFYVRHSFNVPVKVELMHTMRHPVELINAIAMAVVVCTVTSIPSAYSSETKEIYEFFKSLNADVSVWGQTEFLVYTAFDTLIVSVMSGIFFHGSMFAVLRQFGDIFAIVVTSVTAGLLTENFNEMIAVTLVTAVGAVGMLRSGSIFTSVAVQVVYRMYLLAMAIIEVDPSENMFLTRGVFMAVCLLSGMISSMIIWLTSRNRKFLAKCRSELTFAERLGFSVRTFPYLAVVALCIAYSAVSF